MPDDYIADLLRKVRRIQITANRSVNDLMAGQYKSVFRGRGMEFEEVREYQPGDDIRSIDWNVTARTGDCYVKRFREERELTVIFVVDISASGDFGSGQRSKRELITEIAAMLMFSALKNNDKVGVAPFAETVQEYLPPRKGKAHVLRSIRQLLSVQPTGDRTDLTAPLRFLNRVLKRRAVIFYFSDFLGPLDDRVLALTHRRHDVTAVTVADSREQELPNVGFLTLRDAESGRLFEVDTRSRLVRQSFRKAALAREARLEQRLKRLGVAQLALNPQGDYLESLHRYFRMRERRQSH